MMMISFNRFLNFLFSLFTMNLSCRYILLLGTILGVAYSLEDPVIELPTGKILGRQDITYANTTYYAFQKIPYATPPLGSLRLKAPQPAQTWEGVLNATILDVSCYQLQSNSPTDSEDCLFVNVFTPVLPENENDPSLPVLLYIHGGSFRLGSSILAPPDLFVDNGVILVTINYRLGPFGFLSTQDDIIPGNYGLKDQRLAIEWTHQNIHLFGGNPDQITVVGQSAGSASTAYQLLHTESEGLFRGVILESGSFLSPWAFQREPRSKAFGTAAVLNSTFASSDDSNALLEFLQSLDAEELDAAAEQYFKDKTNLGDSNVSQGSLYAPVVEVQNSDAFITEKMYVQLREGNILKVPAMIGFNSEESLAFNLDPTVLQTVLELFDQNLDLIVPNDMQITDAEEHAQMAINIRNIYTDGKPFGTRLGDVIRYSSDTSYTRSVAKHAELYSSLADTYFYQFSYDGKPGMINVHYDGAESVGHSEEAFYIFCLGSGCSFSQFTENDMFTSKRLIKLWTDFAKYQNPTPEPSELLQNLVWPKVEIDGGDFLYLNISENLEVKNHPKQATLSKWQELYDMLNITDFDTY